MREAAQRYIPGFYESPRAWRKALSDAGAPEGFVGVVAKMRAAVRDEAKAGSFVDLAYSLSERRADGREFWELSYTLLVKESEDGARSAGVTCTSGPPEEGGSWDGIVDSFGQNLENCKRWMFLPEEPEGGR